MRVTTNTSLLDIGNIDIMPWDTERDVLQKCKVIKSVAEIEKNGVHVELMKNIGTKLTMCRKTAQDRDRIALLGHLEEGAILSALDETLIQSGIIKTWEDLAKGFSFDASYGSKLRDCYRFSKKYNLIIYSGCNITLLLKWRPRLEAFLEKYPENAMLLTGGEAPSDSFVFNAKSRSFTADNVTVSKHVAKKRKREDDSEPQDKMEVEKKKK